MMDFIIMTVSFAIAILLASGLALVIMLNKTVMGWYMRYVVKMTSELEGVVEEAFKDKEGL